jgi:hypothetical protein
MIITSPHAGTRGRALLLPIDDAHPHTLLWWLITDGGWHPGWTQYVLSVVTLDDGPGDKPAVHHFTGSTHELLVFSVDPTRGPFDANSRDRIHPLQPVNVVEQFIATDDEMTELAEFVVRAICDGLLNPEVIGAPSIIQGIWHEALLDTLEHIQKGGHDEQR